MDMAALRGRPAASKVPPSWGSGRGMYFSSSFQACAARQARHFAFPTAAAASRNPPSDRCRFRAGRIPYFCVLLAAPPPDDQQCRCSRRNPPPGSIATSCRRHAERTPLGNGERASSAGRQTPTAWPHEQPAGGKRRSGSRLIPLSNAFAHPPAQEKACPRRCGQAAGISAGGGFSCARRPAGAPQFPKLVAQSMVFWHQFVHNMCCAEGIAIRSMWLAAQICCLT